MGQCQGEHLGCRCSTFAPAAASLCGCVTTWSRLPAHQLIAAILSPHLLTSGRQGPRVLPGALGQGGHRQVRRSRRCSCCGPGARCQGALGWRAGLQGTKMRWPERRAAAWWGCVHALRLVCVTARVAPTCCVLCTHLALPRRWQKGKDVYWYTRDVEREGADAASELALVKQREADLMAEVRWGWGAAGITCCCGSSCCCSRLPGRQVWTR